MFQTFGNMFPTFGNTCFADSNHFCTVKGNTVSRGRKPGKPAQAVDVPINQEHYVSATSAANAIALAGKQVCERFGLAQYSRTAVIWAVRNKLETLMVQQAVTYFDIGALLLQAREQETREDFLFMLEQLQMSERSSQQYMQVALRFGDSIDQFKSMPIGKLLAIAQEADDDTIAALSRGERVGDIALEEMDKLPRDELKKRLRKALHEAEVWKSTAQDGAGEKSGNKESVQLADISRLATQACAIVDDFFARADSVLAEEPSLRVRNEIQAQASRIALRIQATFADLAVEFDPDSVAPPQGFTQAGVTQ